MSDLDHLVVAARSLEEGAAWVESKLGVAPAAGGKHPLMGTHNLLLRLDARRFLEVIAIDPQAPAPARPRWFELDTPAMHARLARDPAFIHWVERTDDLEAAVRDRRDVEITAFSRGPHRWRMALTRDGSLPGGGRKATLIQWDSGPHPWTVLPETGVSLLEFHPGNPDLQATFVTPSGTRTIP